MKWSLDMIRSLEPISGLKMKYIKMSVYAPDSATAQVCRDLLPKQLLIHEDENVNFVYLKTPIGNDSFVEEYLEERLCRLRQEINRLNEMTHLQECLIYCVVVHPPVK